MPHTSDEMLLGLLQIHETEDFCFPNFELEHDGEDAYEAIDLSRRMGSFSYLGMIDINSKSAFLSRSCSSEIEANDSEKACCIQDLVVGVSRTLLQRSLMMTVGLRLSA